MGRGIRNTGSGIFLNTGLGVVFMIADVIIVLSVNNQMRRHALIEAMSFHPTERSCV